VASREARHNILIVYQTIVFLPMNTVRTLLSLLAASLFSLGTGSICAANFGVSPLSLDLTAQQRSAVVTVSNDDTKPIQLRVHAMRWTQTESGEDQYVATDDLVFFPKRLEIKPGEQRIIRAGLPASPIAANEKAYRLFVEELPPVELPTDGQTKLSVLLSFALPVFVAPAASASKLEIRSAELARDGTLTVRVANAGTSRARITRVTANNGKLSSDSVSTRYIFPAIEKTFTAKLGAKACQSALEQVKIELDNQLLDVGTIRNACVGS